MTVSRTIAELWVKLGIDDQALTIGIHKAEGALTQLGNTLQKLAVPVAAFGTASYLAIEKYGAMAQGLKDLSYQTGISTQDLQHLQYAATLSGTSFSSVEMALNKLTLSMAESKDKTSAAYKAFMGLGIDPTGKTPQQVFDATAAALVTMEDETTRNAIAMDIYGKSWKDMLPYMNTYIEKADEIKKSPIWTDEDLRRLEQAKINIDKLTGSITIYTGALLGFVENSFSQQTMAKVGVMASAYKKLLGGDIQGFFSDAAAYHDSQARAEAAKITTQAAKNGAAGQPPAVPGGGNYTAGTGNAWSGSGELTGLTDIMNSTQAEFASYDSATQARMIAWGYNPYSANGTTSGGWQASSTYLGPSVGSLAPLYSALKGASGVSSSALGAMGDYETAMAAWRLNQSNSVNTGMYVGGSFGSGEGGAGSTDIYGMRYSDIAKWKAIFTKELARVAAAERKRREDYVIAFTQNVTGVTDPLAVAAATSRALAAELNKAGVT